MEFEELIQNFEGNYGRLLSPFEIELVREMVEVEGYAIELVNEALKIAIGNGKFFPNYVSGVLRRMPAVLFCYLFTFWNRLLFHPDRSSRP